VQLPDFRINEQTWRQQIELAEMFQLMFNVSITVPNHAAESTQPVFMEFEEQISRKFMTANLQWAETEKDTTEYEHFNWKMAQGGNRARASGSYQKIVTTKYIQRIEFTLANLKEISSRFPKHPFDGRPMLIISEFIAMHAVSFNKFRFQFLTMDSFDVHISR
jgi:hypothetical protein